MEIAFHTAYSRHTKFRSETDQELMLSCILCHNLYLADRTVAASSDKDDNGNRRYRRRDKWLHYAYNNADGDNDNNADKNMHYSSNMERILSKCWQRIIKMDTKNLINSFLFQNVNSWLNGAEIRLNWIISYLWEYVFKSSFVLCIAFKDSKIDSTEPDGICDV